ncbi:MAG: class I SAM-dependent methyltransferase [Thermoguttaceae bacterium]|jgi:ubiquinone/menaquinone biosynthesis C-methylase UbiE
MTDTLHVWQREDLAKLFLEGVRGGIPLAAEQIDVMLRLLRESLPKVERLLDLGCGDGILGRSVLAAYPDARAVFLDFSQAMIQAARKKCGGEGTRTVFVVQDLGLGDWAQSVREHFPFDLVVSGFAIHHLPDRRKRELYQEVFALLSPGGMFLNLEHVSSASSPAARAFDELMVDSLWTFHRKQGGTRSKEEVAREYCHRPDKEANILAPVEEQCRWLKEIGFVEVDCWFKVLELALFGGRKPAE